MKDYKVTGLANGTLSEMLLRGGVNEQFPPIDQLIDVAVQKGYIVKK